MKRTSTVKAFSLGAIVLAAGKGTRMRSPLSKLLHVALGEPLVYFPLRALHQAGVRHFVIVVGHAAAEVQGAISRMSFLADSLVEFVEQREQRGTGHAVQVALAAVKRAPQEWVIAYGDSPHLDSETLKNLVVLRRKKKMLLTLLAADLQNPAGYGRVKVVKGKLEAIVEDRDCSAEEKSIRLVNAGVYAAEHAFLAKAIKTLEPKNAQKELYLTDLVGSARGQAMVSVAVDANIVLGVNSQGELARSQKILQQRIVEHWHDSGVSIEGDDVRIGPEVTLTAGAVIERGVTLSGTTHVAASARIEHHAHLHNVSVGKNAFVRAFSYAEDAALGEATQLGPMARLRSGATLLEGAEVGNFCEIKKTVLGVKAKAHHVSYLGDATIGARTNIGAGTIICNYNGFSKPHSEIGEDVFVGSNSTLVAPVVLADRAYVAAGSVITDPVGEDSLALGRARQVTKDGYALQLKAKLKKEKEASIAKSPAGKAKKTLSRATAKKTKGAA